MFEKETEEIANKKLCSERICYNHCNFNSPKHHRCGEWHRCYEIAKESAEFGYNKANEWHYVKDKDYPKDNKPVLCILGDIDSDNYEVGYYNDVGSGEPWHLETYHLPDDDGDNAWGVSAWKEIVPPKESE